MKKPEINQKIIDSLGLSENEGRVFEALLTSQLGRDVSKIARKAGLPRTTVNYILKGLQKRKLAEKVLFGKRYHWKYKRGLEFMIRRPIEL